MSRRPLEHKNTPWIVLVISLMLTLLAWLLSNRYIAQRVADRFEHQTAQLQEAVVKRMLEYEQVLRGGVGLYAASDEVSRDEWHKYVTNSRLQEYYPGIQAMGYSEVVPPEQKKAFEQRIIDQGFPDFAIAPSGERDTYTSITFIEPFDWRNQRAFGFDMYSNEVRRKAMDRAADTGVPSVSGKVTLVQETDQDVQAGLLCYLPVYQPGQPLTNKQQRREALQGYVYAAFRANDLLRGILGGVELDLHFEIFDGDEISSEALLYDSNDSFHKQNAQHATYSNVVHVRLNGHEWTILSESLPSLTTQAEGVQSLMVATGGIIVDILLFLTIQSISQQKERAYALAEGMTEELRHQTEELERSNADLEQFAYIASHDLQEPLRKVATCCQVLADDYAAILDDKGKQWLEYAVDGADRMRTLISELLAFSRAGRQAELTQPTDAYTTCKCALENLETSIDDTGAEVIVGDLPSVRVNESQLMRLFQNLIGNALKYCEGKTPKISITAVPDEGFWQFRIKDNGIGVAPEFRDRIFLIFQRLHRREDFSGTGVGLAICKKIVESHGGTIWVEDNDPSQQGTPTEEPAGASSDAPSNCGSTFCFTLKKI